MKRPGLGLLAVAALLLAASAASAGRARAAEAPSAMEVTLRWNVPAGATEYRLQVVPYHGDGPGLDLRRSIAPSYTIPAPPQWYGLLPDMTYTWTVNFSGPVQEGASTGPTFQPADGTFHTPARSGAGIGAVSPRVAGSSGGLTPVLQWSPADPDVFYYEVQVSTDPDFGPGAFLYHELVHGGASTPPNSYRIPSAYPLTLGAEYYWRVRPRVQGDGAPAPWSRIFTFTATDAPPPAASPPPSPSPPSAPALSIGPIGFGTEVVDEAHCTLDQPGNPIPFGAQRILARFDYTGGGRYTRSWYYSGRRVLDPVEAELPGGAGCKVVGLGRSSGELPSGSYSLELRAGGMIVAAGRVEIGPVRSICKPAFRTVILGGFRGYFKGLVYPLANGQTWRQTGDENIPFLRAGPEALVYEAAGVCWMEVRGTGMSVRVERIG